MSNCTQDEYCVAMSKYADDDETKHRGIHSLEITSSLEELQKTGVQNGKLIGVYYKKNKADSGILFNYCPWCGQDLKSWRDD